MIAIQPASDFQFMDLISADVQGRLTDDQLARVEHFRKMSSEAWVALADWEFLAAWGLVPPSLLAQEAYLWMHWSPLIDKNRIGVVRIAHRYVKHSLNHYSTIFGHCLCNAPASQNLVRWLGGVFGEPEGALLPFKIVRP